MRDGSRDLEGGKNLRTAQNIWMKVIFSRPSSVTYPKHIYVDIVLPFFRGEGSKRSLLTSF